MVEYTIGSEAPGSVVVRPWPQLDHHVYDVAVLDGELWVITRRDYPTVVERILGHIGEPTEAPAVLPARSPPQGELSFDAGVEAAGGEAWPEIDQTGGGDDGWG